MDLRPGDHVDLERDPFADPEDRESVWQYEYARVESVELETPTCAVVQFGEAGAMIGFPVGHELDVAERGSTAYATVCDQVDFDRHLKAGTVLPRVYVCHDADDASEWITDKPGALDGRYGIDYPCGVETE